MQGGVIALCGHCCPAEACDDLCDGLYVQVLRSRAADSLNGRFENIFFLIFIYKYDSCETTMFVFLAPLLAEELKFLPYPIGVKRSLHFNSQRITYMHVAGDGQMALISQQCRVRGTTSLKALILGQDRSVYAGQGTSFGNFILNLFSYVRA